MSRSLNAGSLLTLNTGDGSLNIALYPQPASLA